MRIDEQVRWYAEHWMDTTEVSNLRQVGPHGMCGQCELKIRTPIPDPKKTPKYRGVTPEKQREKHSKRHSALKHSTAHHDPTHLVPNKRREQTTLRYNITLADQ